MPNWPHLFTTLVVVQGFLVPHYSYVRPPISALAAWPTCWIQAVGVKLRAVSGGAT